MGNSYSMPHSKEPVEMLSTEDVLKLAVIKRDRQKVEEILASGFPAMQTEVYEWDTKTRKYDCSKSAFRLAIECDNVEMVRIFLRHGANPNLFVFNESFSARFRGFQIVLRPDGEGISQNILHDLILKNKVEMVKVLLEAGADVNLCVCKEWGNLLGVALSISSNCDNTMVKLLIMHGAGPENKLNVNLPFIAFDRRNIKAMEWLFILGADPDILFNGNSLLHWAVQRHDHEAMKAILEARANPSLLNIHGDTPLHIAADLRDAAAISLLIEKKAKVNARNRKGYSPLHMVTAYYDIGSMIKLIEAGANPDCRDRRGNTPAHIAVIKKNGCGLEVLIRRGANPDLLNSDGLAPIHIAVNEREYDLMNKLLKYGADPELRSGHDGTPICYLHRILDITPATEGDYETPSTEEKVGKGGDYSFARQLVIYGETHSEVERWERDYAGGEERLPSKQIDYYFGRISMPRRLEAILKSIKLINGSEHARIMCQAYIEQFTNLVQRVGGRYEDFEEHLRDHNFAGKEVNEFKIHYTWRRLRTQQRGGEYVMGVEGETPLRELPDDILNMISDMIYRSKWRVRPGPSHDFKAHGHFLIESVNAQLRLLRKTAALPSREVSR